MTARPSRPDETFTQLSTVVDFEPGFALCFVFSDDTVGLSWLQNRLEEHLNHDGAAKKSNFFRFVGAARDAGDFTLTLCARFGDVRNVVWALLPQDKADCHAYTHRLNEQRQRLIASGNFLVLVAPSSFEHELPAWAPDLWSVRTEIFQTQSKASQRVESSVAIAWGTAAQPQADAPPPSGPLSATIGVWQRIYANWQAHPEGSRPAVDLALRASQDAKKLRQFGLALAYAEQALDVADHDLARAYALQALGDLQRRLGQVDSARDLYIQAIALYEKEQDDSGRANALKALGDLQRRLGQVDSARDLFSQAIALYEKEQNDLGRADALIALGDLQSRLEQVDSAHELYTLAIALHEKEQNDLGRANALIALGELQSRLGQLESARELYTQAIALYEIEQADLGRANALIDLGELQSRLGQVDSARDLLSQAIALYEKEQNDLGRANALRALGDLQSHLGQLDSARDLYTQAIALYEKEQADLSLGGVWAALARTWSGSPAHAQQASDAATKALHHANRAGYPPALDYVKEVLREAGFPTA